jgi:hypothetical protein
MEQAVAWAPRLWSNALTWTAFAQWFKNALQARFPTSGTERGAQPDRLPPLSWTRPTGHDPLGWEASLQGMWAWDAAGTT